TMTIGSSMACLPRKYDVTPYMFELCSLRNTALSPGKERITEYIEIKNIPKDMMNKPPVLSYLSWNSVGSSPSWKYRAATMKAMTKYWSNLDLSMIGFLLK